MWRKSGTKLQGRYPATPSGGFMLGLDEFVYLAKSNLNLTIWLVQMHSKLASLVRNNIWTCQIVKFALDFAKNTNPSRPSINPPVVVAGSVLIYILIRCTWSCIEIHHASCYFISIQIFLQQIRDFHLRSLICTLRFMNWNKDMWKILRTSILKVWFDIHLQQ